RAAAAPARLRRLPRPRPDPLRRRPAVRRVVERAEQPARLGLAGRPGLAEVRRDDRRRSPLGAAARSPGGARRALPQRPELAVDDQRAMLGRASISSTPTTR